MSQKDLPPLGSDAYVEMMLAECERPIDQLPPGAQEGVLVERSIMAAMLRDLLQMRKVMPLEKQQLIDMVMDMTFSTAIADISALLDDMASSTGSEELKRAAEAVRSMQKNYETKVPSNAVN